MSRSMALSALITALGLRSGIPGEGGGRSRWPAGSRRCRPRSIDRRERSPLVAATTRTEIIGDMRWSVSWAAPDAVHATGTQRDSLLARFRR